MLQEKIFSHTDAWADVIPIETKKETTPPTFRVIERNKNVAFLVRGFQENISSMTHKNYI